MMDSEMPSFLIWSPHLLVLISIVILLCKIIVHSIHTFCFIISIQIVINLSFYSASLVLHPLLTGFDILFFMMM